MQMPVGCTPHPLLHPPLTVWATVYVT